MGIRRIFAGFVVALLLAVSFLSIKCDLSCGFAQLRSDCHSAQMSAEESMPSGMAMSGMVMPGVNDADSGNRKIAGQPHSARHAVIGEMGPCERQSCDPGQSVAAKVNHPSTAQLDTTLAAAEFSHMASPHPAFHDGRDDLDFHSSLAHSPLSMTLRV